jgi:ankyrin repeat protein
MLLDQVDITLWEELHQTLRKPVDPLWHQLIGVAQVFCCPLKLVELLISMHPEKLQHADSKGWLPLHHAVAAPQGDRRELISMILEAFPAAAYHADKSGRLPFHLACLSGKGTWLLELLKSHNPEAIHQFDGLLELPPVLLAAQSPRSTLTNVFYLLTSSPDVLVQQMDGVTVRSSNEQEMKNPNLKNDNFERTNHNNGNFPTNTRDTVSW